MNHRDRVLSSMRRQEPDRVPLFYRDVAFGAEAGYWESVCHPLAGCKDPAALDDHPWPRAWFPPTCGRPFPDFWTTWRGGRFFHRTHP